MIPKPTKTQWLIYASCFLVGIAAASLARRLVAPVRNKPLQSVAAAPLKTEPARDYRLTPWGDLEARKLPLAGSEEFFADRTVRLQPPRWFFENLGEKQVTELLLSCDLKQQQRDELLDKAHWQIVSNGCAVLPSDELVRSLPASTRQRIYEVLARSSENYAQCFPFRFAPNDFNSRFLDRGLAPDKIEMLRSLSYTNWDDLCFADLEAVTSLLSTDEFSRVVEALYRWPAYRLRLHVHPDSDIDRLVGYWGKGGREKRIRPLLQSLSRVPEEGGAAISVGYLLPAFARLRLNTFPSAWTEPQVAQEDCFWTAMNFFNDQPDARFLDRNYTKKVLQTDYTLVSGQPTYGDIVTLANEKGDALHACIYIADNFVFTKNGINQLSPWILMRMSDMLLLFPSEKDPQVVFFRRKDLSPG